MAATAQLSLLSAPPLLLHRHRHRHTSLLSSSALFSAPEPSLSTSTSYSSSSPSPLSSSFSVLLRHGRPRSLIPIPSSSSSSFSTSFSSPSPSHSPSSPSSPSPSPSPSSSSPSSSSASASASSDSLVSDPYDAPVDLSHTSLRLHQNHQHHNSASFLSSQRIKVLALVAFAMALCNADRVIMSVAIVRLSSLYNWSTSFSGIVQSSFLWGYVLSPIVGGALVDRYGGKNVMACGLALWSLATVLTPWAAQQSILALITMRVLMGVAEGVAMPAMNNMLTSWFPRTERARAVGMSMAGFHLGIVMGLLASPILISAFGVDMPFLTFGLIGAVWLFFWLSFVTSNPQTHPNIDKLELQYIQQKNMTVSKSNIVPSPTSTSAERDQLTLPFALLLSKLPSWAIIVANFMNNWGYFVLLSWMPIYFSSVYGVNLTQASWYSAVPWTMMAAVGCFAGTCSDFLIESGLSITVVRKIMQSIGFVVPAIALIALNSCKSASVAAAWLTVAVGASAFSQAGFLVNFQEVAPRYAGLLHGIANTVGTMGAIISTIGIGYFIQWLGSFQAFLTLTSIMYILSTLFWNLYATGERVIE